MQKKFCRNKILTKCLAKKNPVCCLYHFTANLSIAWDKIVNILCYESQ
jgi:hypothetical protein